MTNNEIRRLTESAQRTMICFTDKGIVYAISHPVLDSWVKLDYDSKTGNVKARINLNAHVKFDLKNRVNCVKLGDENEIRKACEARYEQVKNKPYPARRNRGWEFEYAVTTILAKQEWEPDSVPYWIAPDVVIGGIGYQVKGDRATYYTPTALKKAMEYKGL